MKVIIFCVKTSINSQDRNRNFIASYVGKYEVNDFTSVVIETSDSFIAPVPTKVKTSCIQRKEELSLLYFLAEF